MKSHCSLPSRWTIALSRLDRVERCPGKVELTDDDTALAARLLDGDRDALAQLHDRHLGGIYEWLQVTLGHGPDAEDAAQEVFVALLDALPGYDPQAQPFPTWLWRIVAETTDSIRDRTEPEPVTAERLVELADGAYDGGLTDSLGNADFMRLVASLSPCERQVIILRFMIGLTVPETAAALGKTTAAVNQARHRALQKLRKRIETERRVAAQVQKRSHPRSKRWAGPAYAYAAATPGPA